MISELQLAVTADLAPELAEEPAAEAWRLIRSISHDPTAMAACHQVTQETGLPLAPVRALLVMPLDGTLSMRQLARRLGCDNSYVTPLVDALEQRGLAVRQPHPTDRRIKVIVLTEHGLELARRVQLADTTPPAAFATLSDTELATLRDLLRKLEPAGS
ncbi:MAG TPA: MarR family transcriptional regulator [Streptosporangiaceae bacterium]